MTVFLIVFLTAMEAKIIEIAALGRALHPGMLYDCRSDSVIPGKYPTVFNIPQSKCYFTVK